MAQLRCSKALFSRIVIRVFFSGYKLVARQEKYLVLFQIDNRAVVEVLYYSNAFDASHFTAPLNYWNSNEIIDTFLRNQNSYGHKETVERCGYWQREGKRENEKTKDRKKQETERETDRERKRARDRQRESERQTERERETDRESERQTERERETDRERARETDRERETESEKTTQRAEETDNRRES